MLRLISLAVADEPSVWTDLGFVVREGQVRLGGVDIVCVGNSLAVGRNGGIVGWTFGESNDNSMVNNIDGIPVVTAVVDPTRSLTQPSHPNGVSAIDHLVVSTPDLDRTIAAFEAAGLECRRQRERTYGSGPGATTMRQAFFWFGDPNGPANERVICEVVGPAVVDPSKADRAASFFGLALTSTDLAATAIAMGDCLKPPVTAVQAGRQIATVRSSAGSSVAIAIMSPHVNATG